MQKKRHTNEPEHSNQTGLTLIELTVAMVVSSILLFTVFYTWNHIDKYINKSKHSTMLEKETERLGSMIASQIRRSSEIILWDENRIDMLNPNGSDTLSYYFNKENLLLNNDTVRVLVPDAKVKQFKLIDLDETQGKDKKSMLLDLTLSIESRVGDSASSHHTIQLSQTPPQNSTGNNWGF
jgi:prepilin-type N-terminal cleavage/methylation domain-containing protein